MCLGSSGTFAKDQLAEESKKQHDIFQDRSIFYGICHKGYNYPLSTVVDIYSRKNVFLFFGFFFEGRLTVRLGSKHLLGTVSLEGFCIEKAVRRETSDFCGTCCSQSVRALLFRDPSSDPYSQNPSMVWGEEQEAW